MGASPFVDILLQIDPLDGTSCPISFASSDKQVQEVLQLIRDNQTDLGYVAVNLPFGLHQHVERPVRYFSMLREPVDRCISFWYFTCNNHPAEWRELERYDFDPQRLVEEAGHISLSNHQVRMITGAPRVTLTREDMELAKDLIQSQYAFVGALEAFDKSLEEMARVLDWPIPIRPRLNVGDRSRPEKLPDRARRSFADLNELDTKLHGWLVNDYLPRRFERSQ
jgi:hypothetical protein